MEIIDTHAQLWTAEAIMAMPEAMREGYVRVFGSNLPTLADTVADAETNWDYRVSNELVAEAVRGNPDRLIGFASVDPHKGDAAGGSSGARWSRTTCVALSSCLTWRSARSMTASCPLCTRKRATWASRCCFTWGPSSMPVQGSSSAGPWT